MEKCGFTDTRHLTF